MDVTPPPAGTSSYSEICTLLPSAGERSTKGCRGATRGGHPPPAPQRERQCRSCRCASSSSTSTASFAATRMASLSPTRCSSSSGSPRKRGRRSASLQTGGSTRTCASTCTRNFPPQASIASAPHPMPARRHMANVCGPAKLVPGSRTGTRTRVGSASRASSRWMTARCSMRRAAPSCAVRRPPVA